MSNGNRTSAFWDEAKVRAAVDGAETAKAALERLGYAQKPGNAIRLREACERYGLDHPSDVRRRRREAVREERPAKESRSPRWSLDDLRAAAAGATSMKQVLDRLGLAAAGRNYTTVEAYAASSGVELPARRNLSRAAEGCDPQLRSAFLEARAEAQNQAHMLELLGWVMCGGSYSRLRRVAEQLGVDLPGGDARRGSSGSRWRRPLEEILVKGSTYNSTYLKRRLIEAELLDEECAECHTGPIWNGKPLVLQLEHRDGDSTNNELENLELLCPNCHSQTDTFCRRTPAAVSA